MLLRFCVLASSLPVVSKGEPPVSPVGALSGNPPKRHRERCAVQDIPGRPSLPSELIHMSRFTGTAPTTNALEPVEAPMTAAARTGRNQLTPHRVQIAGTRAFGPR